MKLNAPNNENAYREFVRYLKSLADEEYGKFARKLSPGGECPVLGVRVPRLRAVAKEIAKGDGRGYLDYVTYELKEEMSREEIMVMGLVTGNLKLPFGELCQRIRFYAERTKSWECCDTAAGAFKEIKNYIEEYKIEIYGFLNSENPWKVRLALVILIDFYLGTEENTLYALRMANKVNSDEFYVNMAEAWLFSEAFAEYPNLTRDFLGEEFSQGEKIKKMTAGKIRDSRRVSDEDKAWAKNWARHP